MKLPSEKICRKLEAIGYGFYEETKKSRCYRAPKGHTGAILVYVSKNSVPEAAAKSILWQAGAKPEEIESFIRACKA